MKKWLIALTLGLVILSLAGCGQSGEKPDCCKQTEQSTNDCCTQSAADFPDVPDCCG